MPLHDPTLVEHQMRDPAHPGEETAVLNLAFFVIWDALFGVVFVTGFGCDAVLPDFDSPPIEIFETNQMRKRISIRRHLRKR